MKNHHRISAKMTISLSMKMIQKSRLVFLGYFSKINSINVDLEPPISKEVHSPTHLSISSPNHKNLNHCQPLLNDLSPKSPIIINDIETCAKDLEPSVAVLPILDQPFKSPVQLIHSQSHTLRIIPCTHVSLKIPPSLTPSLPHCYKCDANSQPPWANIWRVSRHPPPSNQIHSF